MFLSGFAALVTAALCSASMAIVMRFFNASGHSRYGMILGNYLTCTLIGFLMITEKQLLFSLHSSTFICGIIGGFLFVLSLVCIQTGIQKSGAILTSAFSKLGLLVPLALSILVFRERPTILQALGLLAVFAAIRIISDTKIDTQNIDLPFLLIVLLTNGLSESMAKIYSTVGIHTEESVYMFLVFLTAAILTGFLLCNETRKTKSQVSPKELAAGILVGIPNYFSAVFLLRSLSSIPAVIAYPVFSTGTILIVTAISIPLFKERLNKNQSAGLMLILAALVLLNL